MAEVRRIPVRLGQQETIIGRGTIDAKGDLTIVIPGSAFVAGLEHMITVDQIRELTVGVAYAKAEPTKTFHCPRDDRSFETMTLLKEHVELAHPEMEGWDEA